MKITKPEITRELRQGICQANVETGSTNQTLWYSVQEPFGDLLSDSSDAFLVALLVPAMAMGEDIYISGTVTDRLLYQVSGPLQRLLIKVIPSLVQVKVYAEHSSSSKSEPASGVATGFSGGIDSFCVLADHYHSQLPEKFKITHLLFNNVGSHGSGGERLFRERYERLMPAAERLELPFLMINSNLDTFYGKRLRFQQTHTLRNMSVALLLKGGVGRYLYASTYKYENVFIGPSYDIAYSDMVTLPMVSTGDLDAFSVGSEYSRVEKTLRTAEVSDSYTTLDVCVNADNDRVVTNCSTCWKCLRTLATLEIAGSIDRYSPVFDLKAYENCRESYFLKLFGSDDPLLREILEFARARNYSFPISARFMQYRGVYPVTMWSKRLFRKLKQ